MRDARSILYRKQQYMRGGGPAVRQNLTIYWEIEGGPDPLPPGPRPPLDPRMTCFSYEFKSNEKYYQLLCTYQGYISCHIIVILYAMERIYLYFVCMQI